jgi:hypothetical protein
MTPRQYDATMIHFRRWSGSLVESRQAGPLNQRPAASRAPVYSGLFVQYGMTLAANAFHI